MTEEEAKTKWCPHKEETAISTDRRIGSDCMMWRWFARYEINTNEQLKPISGFCGLAGKP